MIKKGVNVNLFIGMNSLKPSTVLFFQEETNTIFGYITSSNVFVQYEEILFDSVTNF